MPNLRNPFRENPIRPARARPVPEWAAEFDALVEKAVGREPTGKRGEELFHLILSGIREIYEVDATIAGGAVRDFAAGVTHPKDIDVFIPMKWEPFVKGSDELGWQGPPYLISASKGYKDAPGDVGCFFPTTARLQANVQGLVLDLVMMDSPLTKEHVATFPVFAQRGVWTLESGLCLSPEARTDIEAKTFTIDPAITDKARLKNVADKVKGWLTRPEYAGWKMVEPDHKEWWELKDEQKAKEEAIRAQILTATTTSTLDVYKAYWDNKGVIGQEY